MESSETLTKAPWWSSCRVVATSITCPVERRLRALHESCANRLTASRAMEKTTDGARITVGQYTTSAVADHGERLCAARWCHPAPKALRISKVLKPDYPKRSIVAWGGCPDSAETGALPLLVRSASLHRPGPPGARPYGLRQEVYRMEYVSATRSRRYPV